MNQSQRTPAQRTPAQRILAQRILVVDDEPQITRVLRRSLAARGYDVQVAGEGEEALQIFNAWKPDLVVTDLSMPNMGGLELCRRIRGISQTPIIVLSVQGEERAKVEALDVGADDYVTKPFGMDELLARVRAALRRGSVTSGQQGKALEAGDFEVDLEARIVKVRGAEVRLTPKEFDLLVYLIRYPHKVLTHRALLGAVWGGDYVEQTEYLRVFIGQLRKKIEFDPAEPRYILTEPWVGYRFNPEG
jgi:two-component system KDP operon response regulator KdpE